MQRYGELDQALIGSANEILHFVTEMLVATPTAADHLAPHQVERLDAICTFVNLGNPAVPDQLLLAPLANETMTAKDLLAMHRGL
ncbi:hypothetical protein D3C84_782880 [compost metagenome]